MTPRDEHSPRPMIASSRPVYSPTSTVIFAVPISTAPMKVVLELTGGLRLRRREDVETGGESWGRSRGGSDEPRLLRLQHHRHLAAEREIDSRPRRPRRR